MKRIVGNGLDPEALVAGKYDTRLFRLGAKTKTLFAGGRKVEVRQDTEKMIVLPNGHTVRVSRDASGCATQIEENERQHAVVRPHTYAMKLSAMSGLVDEKAERERYIELAGKYGGRVPRKVRRNV
jgi:hypothetical protein